MVKGLISNFYEKSVMYFIGCLFIFKLNYNFGLLSIRKLWFWPPNKNNNNRAPCVNPILQFWPSG